MAFDENLNPNGEKGKRLTILSIEGGGVRGIIPARILEVLEAELRRLERLGNAGEHHLWEYFDMIAGTSSGGLITAMITTPTFTGSRVPSCDATQVVQFFTQDAVKIFPKKFPNKSGLRWLLEGFASVFGPIYSARPLEKLLFERFRETCLSEALTSVIIPAFDTVNEVPVFFSNLTGVDSAKPLYNVYVKDACRGTTAVPILFPPARFEEQPGRSKVFNVIDGGIAVNDPTLVAVTQAIAKRRPRDCADFSNVLVLSLGAGQHPMRFLAKTHWSSVQWLLNPSGSPLLNSFLSASDDMIEYYTSMIFDAHQSGHHYLRIQTDILSQAEFLGIDDATRENLDTLWNTAGDLLTSPVSKRNFATGNLEAIPDGGKNEDALRRFARWLVDERQERPANFGQQTAVDWCFSMMRRAVGGSFLMMGAAVGGFGSMMKRRLVGFL